MRTELIDYFHKGVKTTKESEKVDFAKINKTAVTLGYIIHPDCCNKDVYSWLKTLTHNYNATFYKEWVDVISKNRFELFLDQILHYATTYGTDFELGNGYVPNDGAIVPAFKDLKVIEPITVDELFKKCVDVLKSGIALRSDTVEVMCGFVYDFVMEQGSSDDYIISLLSDISNREAQTWLARRFNLLPKDEFGMLRCLMDIYTHKPMLIKDTATISQIKIAAKCLLDRNPLMKLNDEQLRRLSRIFYRFKPLFLAMKNRWTAHIINRIRRLAKANHTPFQIGFWENIISTKRPISEVKAKLAEIDNFKKVRLLMLVNERIKFPTKTGLFQIRNGKMYVRERYNPSYDMNWLSQLYSTIRSSLIESLSKKKCTVKFPVGCEISLPTTEKNFVGNFPFGTKFTMSNHNVIGVYWRNEWGTRDYDLSMTDLLGRRIGWNARYSTVSANGIADVIYSGDMTNADPEAVELMYSKKDMVDGIFMLNKFCGEDNSQFRFFYANECMSPKSMVNHMVDPNNIKFDVMVPFDGQGQKTIGMVLDNEFYFMDFGSGYNRVSNAGKYVNVMIDAMKNKAKSFVYLKDILLDAGFVIAEDDETPDIDFTNLEKDTLINLLTEDKE